MSKAAFEFDIRIGSSENTEYIVQAKWCMGTLLSVLPGFAVFHGSKIHLQTRSTNACWKIRGELKKRGKGVKGKGILGLLTVKD